MQVTDGRCLKCGAPIEGNDAWYCSEECYDKALADHIPDKFKRGYQADPRYQWLMKNAAVQEISAYLDEWEAELAPLVVQARDKLHQRIEAEVGYATERERKRAEELLFKERLKELERVRVEQERQHREREKHESKLREQEQERQRFEETIQTRSIPEPIRFEHTHILGPQGTGKTTLMERLFLDDISKDYAYIIIEPKGLMIERLAKLKAIRDRVVLVDPVLAPALNMFKLPRMRPEAMNELVELFTYIFSTAKSPITQRQSVPFSFVVRFVLWLGGDLNILMDVLEDNPKRRRFAAQIEQFCAEDETGAAGRFFRNYFYADSFTSTREQIATRLFEIVGRPELARIFLAPENKLDLLDCIQNRKIVLVNTGRAVLGDSGSQLLGRYMIAMAMNAAISRSLMQQRNWPPAFLMIDEFNDFVHEENTPKLLRLLREYRMGVIMAHQSMFAPELSDNLRSAISSSAIKYCASPEGPRDGSYMKNDMRCDADFLDKQQVYDGHVRFACYARGMKLEHPFQISIPIGAIDREPKAEGPVPNLLTASTQTHDPASAGSRALKNRPTEADTPIVPSPQPDKPAIGTHTETGEDW